MEQKCVVNKTGVKKSKVLKNTQRNARKYYQEKLFRRAAGAPKAKIRKLADLNQVGYTVVSDIELTGQKREERFSKEELVSLCKEVHLTGRSGNGFEVSKKLEAYQEKGGTLIVNAVECDPGLVTDSWLYKNKQSEILQGAQIIQNALSMERVILATKEPLRNMNGIRQVKVPDRFPMGYEKYLIKQVLGVTLEAKELPQDKGILVMNLQTVIAIAEMARDVNAGKYKYITVANLLTAETKVVRVCIGNPVDEIVKKCFTKKEISEGNLYVGSGAFHCHAAAVGEQIGDTIGYIAIGHMPNYAENGKCKGCGACTKNCPAGVMVHKIVQHVDKNGMNHADACNRFNATACIGCGTCTYGCVAGKDVREVVLWAKTELS